MQPETKEKPAKEHNGSKYSPAEQWDLAAFQLILKELAPKGFSEIKRGPWRGKVKSNLEFLPKQTVNNCQKISAQLVRTFRARLFKDLEGLLDKYEADKKEWEEGLRTESFLAWNEKKKIRLRIALIEGQLLGIGEAMVKLQDLLIK